MPCICSDAKTDLKNEDGSIPLQVAELNEQEAVVEVLKKGKSEKASKDTNGKASTTEKKAEKQAAKQDVYL